MTSKERILAATLLKEPDRVPVTPDTSNMIPCRLTGKPFWDIYLYQNPPLWKAYLHCCKHFGFDGWLPSASGHCFRQPGAPQNTKIVFRNDERIITRAFHEENGKKVWADRVNVYYRDNPPTSGLHASKIGLPESHDTWEDIEGVREWPTGREMFEMIREEMGDHGVVGGAVGLPSLGKEPEGVYEYYDHPERVKKRLAQQEESIIEQARRVLDLKPDVLMVGVSGYVTLHGPKLMRELGLSTLQRVTALAKERGTPTHLHCCGHERALVEMAANETDLNLINPLERPPMGDCDLAEIKRTFGRKIALMGNLHTTEVMLHGTPDTVREEAKWCIDVAAEGGGFILSTGDQCGRDTPDENIRALVEMARDYGKY
ncbi:MAG: hypothetical protein GXP25_05650 [Planctomycetes bacterium]|nr:hypothetical protein [Planctomycetota bacterium]